MGNNFHKLVNVSPNPALKTVGTSLTVPGSPHRTVIPVPLPYNHSDT